jgi:hypothetical protein
MADGLPLGEAALVADGEAAALGLAAEVGDDADVVLVDVEAPPPVVDVVDVDLPPPPPHAASNAATTGALNPSAAARRSTARRLSLPLRAPSARSRNRWSCDIKHSSYIETVNTS